MRTDLDIVRAALGNAARSNSRADADEGGRATPKSPEVDRSPPPGPHAAVSAVLRQADAGAEVLLIRRAQQEGDPWSGHMALPGGHREPGDVDLAHTAVRETREEVGLDLDARGQLLARLPLLRAGADGRGRDLSIVPLVFAIEGPYTTRPNPCEVQEIIWAPLRPLLTGAAASQYVHQARHQRYHLPAFDVDGRIVWGLTYRILVDLLSLLEAALTSGNPSGTAGDPGSATPEGRGP